jgi:hypothetical protein
MSTHVIDQIKALHSDLTALAQRDSLTAEEAQQMGDAARLVMRVRRSAMKRERIETAEQVKRAEALKAALALPRSQQLVISQFVTEHRAEVHGLATLCGLTAATVKRALVGLRERGFVSDLMGAWSATHDGDLLADALDREACPA